jgi:hypothetical protein
VAIRSYLVRFSTDIPVWISDEDVQNGDLWGHVMHTAQLVLDNLNMNERDYSLTIVAHIEEKVD